MDKPFGKLIRSDPFTFHIGPEKVPFLVHSETIAKQSPALDALVNSKMMEALSKTVAWPDVDEDTFVRFCEFCYLGDYSPPSCGRDISSNEKEIPSVRSDETVGLLEDISFAGRAPEAPAVVPSPTWFSTAKSKKGKKSTAKSHNLLRDKDYPLPEKCWQFTEQFNPFSSVTEEQDFTPVFLGHARLYVIADKYCIQTLKDLVLYKLSTTLKRLPIFKKRIRDIIKLIRFTYHEGNTRGDTTEIDPLRELVTCYVAAKLKEIAMDASFLEVLQDGGEFVVDFWKVVWENRAQLEWK